MDATGKLLLLDKFNGRFLQRRKHIRILVMMAPQPQRFCWQTDGHCHCIKP